MKYFPGRGIKIISLLEDMRYDLWKSTENLMPEGFGIFFGIVFGYYVYPMSYPKYWFSQAGHWDKKERIWKVLRLPFPIPLPCIGLRIPLFGLFGKPAFGLFFGGKMYRVSTAHVNAWANPEEHDNIYVCQGGRSSGREHI